MKITVITINLNNLNGLCRTVESVLSQTFDDYEYIVIDGESTDGSKEYLERTMGANRWLSEPDSGIYNAMNKGIRMAHGEYCIFMNSGDTFCDGNVLRNAAPLLDGKDFYMGNTVTVLGTRKHKVYSPELLTLDFLFDGFISHQSTFTKTSLLKKRPYNENLKIASDWEFFVTENLQHTRVYEHLDLFVSNFILDGISYTNQELSLEERKMVLEGNVPIILDFYRRHLDLPSSDPFERKIQISLKKTPLSRDMKILRNSLKFLLRDLFIFLFRYHKYGKV